MPHLQNNWYYNSDINYVNKLPKKVINQTYVSRETHVLCLPPQIEM